MTLRRTRLPSSASRRPTTRRARGVLAQHSDCRQASFTYPKARRFKEFFNLPSSLDFKAGDDTINVVAFEMVRTISRVSTCAMP